ncbi:hypothetical protein NB311A_19976 [Nitrobacter sp. Nb-311A]|nr:hypothetical protein NB311A_19976 [Nitrobacter sp. Nb-311A]
MKMLILVAALACGSGDRLMDLRDKIPLGLKYIDLIVSMNPYYARFYIYQPGYPDSLQQCCSGRASGVLRVPVMDGRFCIRQSQRQMSWNVRVVLNPGREI